MRRCGLLLGIGMVAAVPLSAQRLWLTASRVPLVGIQIDKGFFQQRPNYTPQLDGLSGVATVFGRVRIDPKMMLTAEIPFAHAAERFTGPFSPTFDRTSDKFGNPWIGIDVEADHSTSLEIGFRPDISSGISESAAQEVGFESDFDHFDAWYEGATVFGVLAHAGRVPDRGLFTVGVVGGTYAFVKSGRSGPAYADYGLRVGERWPEWIASVALSGHMILNQCSGCSIDQRMVNQVAASVINTRGKVQPELGVRVFLDPSARETMKAIMVLGTTIHF